MEILRARLISKINDILSQAVSEDSLAHAQLSIEANLVFPTHCAAQNTSILLEAIDIDQLRTHVANESQISRWQDPTHSLKSPQYPLPPITGVVAAAATFDHDTNGTLLPGLSDASDGASTPFRPVTERSPLQMPPVNDIRSSDSHAESTTIHANLDAECDAVKVAPVDKLIEGIWEQIHKSHSIGEEDDLKAAIRDVSEVAPDNSGDLLVTARQFGNVTKRCIHTIIAGRMSRALELILQAHWVDCFDARVDAIRIERPDLKQLELKKAAMAEACNAFSWSEKELRNKTAVWKGYRDIKATAGWCALVFAGPGVYRFCKYRQGFDEEATVKLQAIKIRLEVAADTLQPQWRQLLSLIGATTDLEWTGHPHDYTVSLNPNERPLPLAPTYYQWDPHFTFRHLTDSLIDNTKWPSSHDPRKWDPGPTYLCKSCTHVQSPSSTLNACECFPTLYSPHSRSPAPVQIFRTLNGKNNGLLALCAFPPGTAIGEFTGLITKDLADVDVMQSQAGDNEPYQIWQGRCGNFTRFINHSCKPNAQFVTFSWLGIQRIVVVSTERGVQAGVEVTVDYSGRYWDNLDKICLCGETCCRYGEGRRRLGGR